MAGQNFPELLLWEESVGKADTWIVLRVGINVYHADNQFRDLLKLRI